MQHRAENTLCRAAIMPNANIVFSIDIADARSTDIIKQVEDQNAAIVTATSDATREKLEQATGLTRNDLVAALFAANFTNMSLNVISSPSFLSDVDAVAALTLAKPLTHKGLLAAMQIMNDNKHAVQVTEVSVEGKPAVAIRSANPTETPRYAATSKDGKTVYVAFNKRSLTSTLQRETSGSYEKICPDLQMLEKQIPDHSQIRLLFRRPESSAMPKLSSNNEPFGKLQTISAGINLDKQIHCRAALTFTGSESAETAAAQLRTLLPLFVMATMQSTGNKTGVSLPSSLRIEAQDTVCNLSFTLSESDIIPQIIPQTPAHPVSNETGRTAAQPKSSGTPAESPRSKTQRKDTGDNK
ncbi:MAG: hypothetical protein JXN60_08235 [Lentisphaerae bacterium]|nr:hypothetical protein [Lentisphaerota bacterium]